MQGDRREAELADSLSAVGLDLASITTLADAKEPVYEVNAESGRYFAKRLTDEKGAAMCDVLDRDLAVSMPNSTVVRNGNYVLVMEPAAGRPLSLTLPVCLLPGIWRVAADSLSRAAREVGLALGELHTGMRSGSRRADDDDCRLADRLRLDRSLRERLSNRTVRETGRLFDELRETRLPFTRIHGDPTPHNIYWDARTGDVDVIDFNLRRSVAVEDLVVFESGIELMVARVPYARRSQEGAVIEAFRSGYTEAGPHDSIPGRTVSIAKAAYYAHLLSKFLRGTSPDTRRERLTRYTDRRITERKIESLVSRL